MEKIHHRSPGSVRVDRIRSFAFRDVTKADIEAVRDSRRAAAAATRKQGEVGINRLLVRCRHLFNWAIEEGYLEATPFKRGGQTVVRLTKETPRDRRLVDAGEEDRLLAAAALKALIRGDVDRVPPSANCCAYSGERCGSRDCCERAK